MSGALYNCPNSKWCGPEVKLIYGFNRSAEMTAMSIEERGGIYPDTVNAPGVVIPNFSIYFYEPKKNVDRWFDSQDGAREFFSHGEGI